MHDEEMTPDEPVEEIRLRIQALVDNELPEEEIDAVLAEIQGSYEFRNEFAELLRIKRQLGGSFEEPPADWLAQAERKVSRRVSRGLGTALVLGSYLLLLGYALLTLFTNPTVPLILAVLVTAGVFGGAVLFGNAVADRLRERKNDRYREIIR